ncbi:glycosyltransferase family 48 protein [Hypholoma sublateritium FD-334 SS-4]|uniref:Glycosyltransferase family 48 protein n=1 Tax=Hypholoma sublateritium (strain FD-334 SS-4) TaxID=945553 RepID=A0A0D2LDI0_HYPSF|nr:glycosyltransferase family 48 protein [Hypholoma sublateritium FD-334 SS-4]
MFRTCLPINVYSHLGRNSHYRKWYFAAHPDLNDTIGETLNPEYTCYAWTTTTAYEKSRRPGIDQSLRYSNDVNRLFWYSKGIAGIVLYDKDISEGPLPDAAIHEVWTHRAPSSHPHRHVLLLCRLQSPSTCQIVVIFTTFAEITYVAPAQTNTPHLACRLIFLFIARDPTTGPTFHIAIVEHDGAGDSPALVLNIVKLFISMMPTDLFSVTPSRRLSGDRVAGKLRKYFAGETFIAILPSNTRLASVPGSFLAFGCNFYTQDDKNKGEFFLPGNEAERRISFFTQSLTANIPPPLPVDALSMFTVLTAHYSEKTLLSFREDGSEYPCHSLRIPRTTAPYRVGDFVKDAKILAEDSVTFNGVNPFANDVKGQYKVDDLPFYFIRFQSTADDFPLYTRIWTSLRVQTLNRTVCSMMNYSKEKQVINLLHRVENRVFVQMFGVKTNRLERELERIGHCKFKFVVSMQRFSKFNKEARECRVLVAWTAQILPNVTGIQVPQPQPSTAALMAHQHSFTLPSSQSLVSANDNLSPLKIFVYEVLNRPHILGSILQDTLYYLWAVHSNVPEILQQEKTGIRAHYQHETTSSPQQKPNLAHEAELAALEDAQDRVGLSRLARVLFRLSLPHQLAR